MNSFNSIDWVASPLNINLEIWNQKKKWVRKYGLKNYCNRPITNYVSWSELTDSLTPARADGHLYTKIKPSQVG